MTIAGMLNNLYVGKEVEISFVKNPSHPIIKGVPNNFHCDSLGSLWVIMDEDTIPHHLTMQIDIKVVDNF